MNANQRNQPPVRVLPAQNRNRIPLNVWKNSTIQPDQDAHYWLGVEFDANQIRVSAMFAGAKPDLSRANSQRRASFYAVGAHRREEVFKPTNKVEADEIQQVLGVVAQFIDDISIPSESIDSIQSATILGRPLGTNDLVPRDQEALLEALQGTYRRAQVAGGQYTAASAAQVEQHFGANAQRNVPQLLYVTISRNLSQHMLQNGMPNIAPQSWRLFHKQVDGTKLLEMGKKAQFIGADYQVPQVDSCELCGNTLCLSQLASGQAIADLAAKAFRNNAAGRHAVEGRAGNGEAIVTDLGGVHAETGLDAYSVFGAAYEGDRVCNEIVTQAGIALAISLVENQFENNQPGLLVVGGAVPMGNDSDLDMGLGARRGIDATIERAINEYERYEGAVKVTRSRFAGYTGLLGVTLVGL